MWLPLVTISFMRTFVAKLPDDRGEAFQRYCEVRKLSPYSVLVDYINELVTSEEVVTNETTGNQPTFNFSLAGVIFPTTEAALLAYDLLQAKTGDTLPDWFRRAVEDKVAANPSWDYERLLKKLESRPDLIRQMVIEETEASSREQDLKLTERPSTPEDLSDTDKQSPRITLTDEEADAFFDDIIQNGLRQ